MNQNRFELTKRSSLSRDAADEHTGITPEGVFEGGLWGHLPAPHD